MPPDPPRLADVRAWLRKASQDLRAAEVEWDGDRERLAGDIVFHCQQAAEKAFKAYLAWHDQPFRKTHSLEELGEACARIDPALRPAIDRAVPMSEYAWRFRYPGEPDDPEPEEVGEAMGLAREVFKAVLDRLPPEATPGP